MISKFIEKIFHFINLAKNYFFIRYDPLYKTHFIVFGKTR